MSRVPFVLPLIALFACKSAPPADSGPGDTEVVDTEVTDTVDTVDTTPECGPAALCSRSINECAVEMEQADCEGWYANTANCADMDAYTSCNCDCILQETCDGYFACGNICFNDHC
jgi:hypothetical protein